MESQNLNYNPLEQEIDKYCGHIRHLAEQSEDNTIDLVMILRKVEELHREIRETMLESSLPDTRHHLYLLLKHLEETGGWPYIPRIKLGYFCQRLLASYELESQLLAEKSTEKSTGIE
jgi:hypothetical protein